MTGQKMTTETITIQVDPKAARAFDKASMQERRKMQFLLSLRLQDLTTPNGRSLKEVMDDVGARAEKRGITPAILESLLNEE
jgi:hypothetical protein